MDTAAIIVTYQSADCIGRAVESCLAAGLDVFVVDNASTDRTGEAVRHCANRGRLTLIENSENLGFAGAVNQGVRACSHPYILLLNPDAAILDGLSTVEALQEACRDPHIGAAAGPLIGEDGTYQEGFSVRRLPTPAALSFEALGLNRLWPSNPANRHYRCRDHNPAEPGFVEQPAAAFLLFRRDAFEAVNGFDDRFYPIWFEDVDFCKRLAENGLRVRWVPRARASHIGGHSAGKLPSDSKIQHWYGSLLEYGAKHFSRRAHATVSLAVALGGLLRLLMGILQHTSLKPVGSYAKVIRLACRSLLVGGDRAERISSRKAKTNRAQIHVL